MKKICTGISPDFVKKWTVEEAVREVLQNYLDSRKEFDCKGRIWHNDGVVTVRDYGPGIQVRHLALGVSEKNDEAIGRFGKGLKQALLVLARENRNPSITSNGMVIEPTIEYSEDYQADMMHLNIEEATGQAANVKGCWITFDGSEWELEHGKSYFMHFLKSKYSKIDDNLMLPGGKIFVNGSCVGYIDNAIFSYNLNHAQAENVMSSDRDMIDQDRFREVAKDMLSKMESRQGMVVILDEFKQHNGEALWFEQHTGTWAFMASVKAQNNWKRAFYEVFGKQAVISDDQFDTEAGYRGYEPHRFNFEYRRSLEEYGVLTSTGMMKDIAANQGGLKDVELTQDQQEVFSRVVSLVSEHYADTGTVRVVEELNSYMGVPSQGGANKVRGCYVREADEICLVSDVLRDPRQALEVLIHETAHKVSGHRDISQGFETELGRAASKIMCSLIEE